MDKKQYTLDFAKDYIQDMEEYFKTASKDKPSYTMFNAELKENLDFDLLNKELQKHDMSISFNEEKQMWQIFKN